MAELRQPPLPIEPRSRDGQILPPTIADVRRTRHTSGLSLDIVSERSRIPVSLLRELEWGDLHNWPTGLYGRIQVTRYARAAGLDEDAVRRIVCPMLDADPGPAPTGTVAAACGSPGVHVRIVEPTYEPGETLFADEDEIVTQAATTDDARHEFFEPRPLTPAPATLATPDSVSVRAPVALSHESTASSASARPAPIVSEAPDAAPTVESPSRGTAPPARASGFLFLSRDEAAAQVASASLTRTSTLPAVTQPIDVVPVPPTVGHRDPGETAMLSVDDRRHLGSGVSRIDRVEPVPRRWPLLAAAVAAVTMLGVGGGVAYLLMRPSVPPTEPAPSIAAGAALYGAPAVDEPSTGRATGPASAAQPAPGGTAATTGTAVPSPERSTSGGRSEAPESGRGTDAVAGSPAPAAASPPVAQSDAAESEQRADTDAGTSVPAATSAPGGRAVAPTPAAASTAPPAAVSPEPTPPPAAVGSEPTPPAAAAPASPSAAASRASAVKTDPPVRSSAADVRTPAASAPAPPAPLKDVPGDAVSLAGGRVAYADGGAIVVRDSGGQERRYVPAGWRGVSGLAASPDGTRLLFRVAGAGGWILTLSDGRAQEIVSNPSATDFAWSADGTSVEYQDGATGEKKRWTP